MWPFKPKCEHHWHKKTLNLPSLYEAGDTTVIRIIICCKCGESHVQ